MRLIYYIKFANDEPRKFIWKTLAEMMHELVPLIHQRGKIEWMIEGF